MSLFFIISKLFTFLFLPPGIFILILFLAAFYAKRFKAIFLFFALCFYLLSNTFVANFLLQPLEQPYNKSFKAQKNVNAVIVLGGGIIAGSANLPLTTDAYKRAIYGIMIGKSQNLPVLFSGGGLSKKYRESDAFLTCAKELEKPFGIDVIISKNLAIKKFSFLVERKSLDTFQNAKFTKEKFHKVGIDKPVIYLVTSAYHMRRAVMLYRHFGFKVIPCATDFKISHRDSNIWDFFPKIGAFKHSFVALHEYFGILSLALRDIKN